MTVWGQGPTPTPAFCSGDIHKRLKVKPETCTYAFPQRLLLVSSRSTGLNLKYFIGIYVGDSFLKSHRTDLIKPETTSAKSLFTEK